MAEDPYEILGVPRDASPDAVKKAYRKKARENHPDLNPDDPEAEERLKKINEAYDRITNPEKYAREDARRRYGAPYNPGYYPGGGAAGTGPGAGNPFGGGGTYQWVEVDWDDIFGGAARRPQGVPRPEASASDSDVLRRAVSFINSANYKGALTMLASVPQSQRTARWYYLTSLANYGLGNTVAAVDQIQKACVMEPGNLTYRHAQETMARKGADYVQESSDQGFSTGCVNPNLLCCAFCCAPALCQPFLFCL